VSLYLIALGLIAAVAVMAAGETSEADLDTI
jgi:hypothetical protein